MNSKIKQVIVMRTDLNMRKGKMVAQGAHASMKFLTDELKSATAFGGLEFSEAAIEWMHGSFTKICVGVSSDEELQDVIDKAKAGGVLVKEIIDSGATEFKGVPTRTCCALGPDHSDKIDQISGSLKLL